MKSNPTLGQLGEKKVCSFLQDQGYEIVEENYRSDVGEIDVIAKHHDYLCFIEVKTRSQQESGHPFEAITSWKKRRIIRCAQFYLLENNLPEENIRFDVIAVIQDEQRRLEFDHLENAFGEE